MFAIAAVELYDATSRRAFPTATAGLSRERPRTSRRSPHRRRLRAGDGKRAVQASHRQAGCGARRLDREPFNFVTTNEYRGNSARRSSTKEAELAGLIVDVAKLRLAGGRLRLRRRPTRAGAVAVGALSMAAPRIPTRIGWWRLGRVVGFKRHGTSAPPYTVSCPACPGNPTTPVPSMFLRTLPNESPVV